MIAKLKGWRTILFSALVAVWGVVQTFDWSMVIVDRQTLGMITLVIGVVGAVLRLFTTGPVGVKE